MKKHIRMGINDLKSIFLVNCWFQGIELRFTAPLVSCCKTKVASLPPQMTVLSTVIHTFLLVGLPVIFSVLQN